MYGPETKDEHKSQIEKSLDGKIELKLEVIFYKKNGKSLCLFSREHIARGVTVEWGGREQRPFGILRAI